MSEPGFKSEGGWPSGKPLLTLLISFGGLLALIVIAGLDAFLAYSSCARRGNKITHTVGEVMVVREERSELWQRAHWIPAG